MDLQKSQVGNYSQNKKLWYNYPKNTINCYLLNYINFLTFKVY